jgi:hypothetical protein
MGDLFLHDAEADGFDDDRMTVNFASYASLPTSWLPFERGCELNTSF